MLWEKNSGTYGKLIDELGKMISPRVPTDNYPESVMRVYHLVVYHKRQPRVVSHLFNDSEAVSFTNVYEKKMPPDTATIKCYRCQKMGHYANDPVG
jgi:hypothetical protein